MNPLQFITTFRKFGNYLAGLFPVLIVIGDFFTSRLKRISGHPALAPFLKRISDNQTAQSIWKFIERFYWRTYSKDRLDLQDAHPESLDVLKPILQLLALLCILIPFTQYLIYPVQIEAFSGFKGIAPGWSVALWLLSLPCAWAALLIGSAVSNRIAFALTATGATFFLSTCVILLPRSYFNLLLGLCVLFSLWFCERSLKSKEKTSLTLPLINSLIVGAAAGVQMLIFTPLKPWLATIVKLPGPLLGIGGGALAGALLGLVILATARFPEKAESPIFPDGRILKMGTAVWTIFAMLLTYLVAGVFRKNLGTSGSLVISSLALSNNYLWPLWYFIGVGIIHKILGSSKAIASTVESFIPKILVKPLLLVALAAALVIAFSEKIALFLANHPGPIVDKVLPTFYQVYLFARPCIWSNPLNVMTVHWLTGVLIFDLVVVCTLAFQKRLTSGSLTRLFFMTIFGELLISEYVFQLSSFTHAPKQSVTALFLFSIWLLWLMHTIGWSLSVKSSPLWPSKGRLAIYCGIATLSILDIHARSACKDFKLTNELFLTMFRGVIEVGLPYFFLVWTSKKINDLPVRISTLLGMFSVGAVTSLMFNALEKLASAHWLILGLMKIVKAQVDSLSSMGTANFDLDVPPSWFIVRAIIYISLLCTICFVARRKLKDKAHASSTIMLLLVAFASGVASFSETLVELPLPNEIRALTAPLIQELTFNCNLLQSFLGCWIPALILGVAQFMSRKRAGIVYALAALIAACAHFYIAFLYTTHVVFMRAHGLLYATMAMLCGVFVLLVTVALTLLKREHETETVDSATDASKSNECNLLTPRMIVVMILTAEVALLPFVLKQASIKFEDRPVQALHHRLLLRTSWVEQPAPNGTSPFLLTTLKRENYDDDPSVLQLGVVASNPQGTRALLKTLLQSAIASKRFQNLTLVSAEDWNKYAPNALTCRFAYQNSTDKLTKTMAGVIVLIPLAGDKTECYSLYANPTTVENEQWELAYAVQQLARATHP